MTRAPATPHTWLPALVAARFAGSTLALPPTRGGGSGESALMTESFFRHASPEIR